MNLRTLSRRVTYTTHPSLRARASLYAPVFLMDGLLSLCHTAYNVAKASVHVGDFASDAAC